MSWVSVLSRLVSVTLAWTVSTAGQTVTTFRQIAKPAKTLITLLSNAGSSRLSYVLGTQLPFSVVQAL